MRFWYFILVIGIIFSLERLLPFIFFRPVLVFPVFVILYLLTSVNFSRDLTRVVATSLLFDVFSGYPFGYFTLAIIILGLSIYFVKKQFIIMRGWSYVWGIFFFFLFIIEFLAFSMFRVPYSYFLKQLPIILIENLAIYLAMLLIFKKTNLLVTK